MEGRQRQAIGHQETRSPAEDALVLDDFDARDGIPNAGFHGAVLLSARRSGRGCQRSGASLPANWGRARIIHRSEQAVRTEMIDAPLANGEFWLCSQRHHEMLRPHSSPKTDPYASGSTFPAVAIGVRIRSVG